MAWARKQAEKALNGSVAGDMGEKDKTTANKKETANSSNSSVEAAKSKDTKLSGKYLVNTKSDSLSLRSGAGTDKVKIAGLKKGSIVQCYGYYTMAGGAKWLLVTVGGNTGFVHSGYLKRL